MIKLYTPSKIVMSLLLAEAWESTYRNLLTKSLGAGLSSVFYYYDGSGFYIFRKDSDQKFFNRIIRNRIRKDRTRAWIKEEIKKFFVHLDEFRELVNSKFKEVNKDQSLKLIKRCLHLFQTTFPIYFAAYHISNNEAMRREFVDVISLIDEARLVSEGMYDAADKFILKILKNKISKQNCRQYKLLNRRNVINLLSGMEIGADIIARRKEGFILTKGKIILGAESIANYFRRHHYQLPEFFKKINMMDGQLSGQSIVAGKVRGQVRLVLDKKGLTTLKKGEILVTPMTSPDFVPYFKRLAAVVTDFGGILCHAAIAAREMKTPCVVGVKIATRVFKDGDMVEVDARKGVVRKI